MVDGLNYEIVLEKQQWGKGATLHQSRVERLDKRNV
jgi:hypothetical protein